MGNAPRVVGLTHCTNHLLFVPSFKEMHGSLPSQGILPGIGAVRSCADSCDLMCHSISRIQFHSVKTTTSNDKATKVLKEMLSKLSNQECARPIPFIPFHDRGLQQSFSKRASDKFPAQKNRSTSVNLHVESLAHINFLAWESEP